MGAATLLLTVVATSCAPANKAPLSLPPPSVVLALTPAEELYELSPARVHLRRLAPQAVRLLAPHWSQVRESDRKAVQVSLVAGLAEDRVSPFVRARVQEAVGDEPELAAKTLEWLRGPLGYEVKFAEATASTGDKTSDAAFYASVTEIRLNRLPEIRMDRLRRLAEATSALATTLDQTESVGTVVARLVNLSRAGRNPLSLAALDRAVEREREDPEVAAAYESVVLAALLARCRELDLDDLDRYIEFASTDAGRWYHRTMAAAFVSAINSATLNLESEFAANARTSAGEAEAPTDTMVVSLASGREVRLLALGQTGPADAPAVVLRYETSLAMGNAAAVTGEAHELWDKVRLQMESDGAKAAVLQPTGSVVGWVFPFASSRKFGWRLEATGKWGPLVGSDAAFGDLQREVLWSAPF